MDPYIGEIRIFSFSQIPKGWMPCNGQTLSVSQNQALFSLLGTTYGGDGRTTFNLPDYRGRIMVSRGISSVGSQYQLGKSGGQEGVVLNTNQIASHSHYLQGVNQLGSFGLNTSGPSEILADPNAPLLSGSNPQIYNNSNTGLTSLTPSSMDNTGGNQPHENRVPYLTLNFCIATVGNYPPRP